MMSDGSLGAARHGDGSQAIAVARRRFAVLEYQTMRHAGILGEDDRVELIEGEIVALNPIDSNHAGQVAQAEDALHRAVGGRATVWVQNPVELDAYSEPEPDLVLLRPRGDFCRSRHPRPADVLLVIEVSDSSARYDREVKLPLCARTGIPEAWIIDLAAPDRSEIHSSPTVHGYGHSRRADRRERSDLPGLSGVSVEVAALLG